MTGKPKAPKTHKTPEAEDEFSTATEVLKMFSDGKTHAWRRVSKKYPSLMLRGRRWARTAGDISAEDAVLNWAMDIVAGDRTKQSIAAQALQAIKEIALDKKGKPTVKLNALKLLGRNCGMSTDGEVAQEGKPATAEQSKSTVDRIERVFVKPEEIRPGRANFKIIDE